MPEDMNISDAISFEGITCLLAPGGDFRTSKKLNQLLRSSSHLHKAKFISCNVYGNCGYVFNDFQAGFEVLDVDGEQSKDVKCPPNFSPSRSSHQRFGRAGPPRDASGRATFHQ